MYHKNIWLTYQAEGEMIMGNNYMKRIKLNIMFWLLIAFLTLGTSMNIFLLGSSHIYNADNHTFSTQITSAIGPEVEDEENTSIIILNNANTSFFQKLKLIKKINLKNIISTSTLVAILKGISINILLIAIFIMFYLNLFKSKPDDLTLINQKVRLDD